MAATTELLSFGKQGILWWALWPRTVYPLQYHPHRLFHSSITCHGSSGISTSLSVALCLFSASRNQPSKAPAPSPGILARLFYRVSQESAPRAINPPLVNLTLFCPPWWSALLAPDSTCWLGPASPVCCGLLPPCWTAGSDPLPCQCALT